MGLSEGCQLKRKICQDEAIRYDDVEIPDGRLVDILRKDQDSTF